MNILAKYRVEFADGAHVDEVVSKREMVYLMGDSSKTPVPALEGHVWCVYDMVEKAQLAVDYIFVTTTYVRAYIKNTDKNVYNPDFVEMALPEGLVVASKTEPKTSAWARLMEDEGSP